MGKGRSTYQRVAAYRERQADKGFKRTEVRVAERDQSHVGTIAQALRRRRQAADDNRPLELILGTINAPRPEPITADTLLDCLLAPRPDPRWQPHLEAFLTEVSVEALHRLVLSGYCSFEDLRRAQRVWGPFRGERHEWIDDMANLALERDARRAAADHGRPQAGT